MVGFYREHPEWNSRDRIKVIDPAMNEFAMIDDVYDAKEAAQKKEKFVQNKTVSKREIERKNRQDNLSSREKAVHDKKEVMRRAHQVVNAVHKEAESLGKAGEYHYAVVVDKTHIWKQATVPAVEMKTTKPKKVAKPSKEKQSKKYLTISKKISDQQYIKNKQSDSQVLIMMKNTLANVRKVEDVDTLCEYLLQVSAGYDRRLDWFEHFPALEKTLKASESRASFISELVLLGQERFSRLRTEEYVIKPKTYMRFIRLLFRLCHAFVTYYADEMTAEMVDRVQTALISMGFETSAHVVFENWKQMQLGMWEEAEDKDSRKGVAVRCFGERGGIITKVEQLKKALDSFSMRGSDNDVMSSLAIKTEKEAEFQLQWMSQDFERSTGSQKDHRVKFRPDAWQKKLLDVVDRQESALVIAPTSAGKTFSCYYAMEQVLRYSNDSHIVYVAPTKALVAQVYAEIYARFGSKSYGAGGHYLTGILLRDHYKGASSSHMGNLGLKKLLECQILVTVPMCLEMLLVSSECKSFVSKLQYVIMDEIHCIGNDDEGSQWEHLVQILPCPFLAMSATIGNADSFKNWLAEAAPHRPIHTVRHGERYSDLQLHVYVNDVDSADVVPLNSTATLSYKDMQTMGFPDDLYLYPPDALAFYKEVTADIRTAETGGQMDALSATGRDACVFWTEMLEPQCFFQESSCITKRHYNYYMRTIKYTFEMIVENGFYTRESFENLLIRLADNSEEKVEVTSFLRSTIPTNMTPLTTNDSIPPQISSIGKYIRASHNSQMYLDPKEFHRCGRILVKRGLVPALVFNLSRAEVERIGLGLINYLQTSQFDKYYGTEARKIATRALNKRREDQWKALILQREVASKLMNSSSSKLKTATAGKEEQKELGKQKEEQTLEKADAEVDLTQPPPEMPGDVAEEFDEEYNYRDPLVWRSYEDKIDKILKRIKFCDKLLIGGIHRGIGIHHSGMSRRYRAAVEQLARMGALRLVISTETLALGINIPCKSTVFTGDSLKLTPLMFRQMSGRAGRRGFDSIGHIIFWELPLEKIRRLVSSELPLLSGAFPITHVGALRFLQSIEMDGKVAFSDSLQRVLMAPLYKVTLDSSKGSPVAPNFLKTVMKSYFRFAVDLLQRYGLINDHGRVESIASLVISLFDYEPGSVLFLSLLLKGVLHRAVKAVDDESVEESRNGKLLGILALCMGSRVCETNAWEKQLLMTELPSVFGRKKGAEVASQYTPFLPPMEDDVYNAVTDFNKIGMDSIRGCVKSLCVSRPGVSAFKAADYLMPFSKISFSPKDDTAWNEIAVAKLLGDVHQPSQIQSPFAALTGTSDEDIDNPVQLIQRIRAHIPIEEHAVCHIAVKNVDIRGKKVPMINSYVLDFYVHGKFSNLVEDNMIDSSEPWYLLDSFYRALFRIERCFEYLCQNNPQGPADVDPVCDEIKKLRDEIFTKHFEEFA
eukprot:GHVO01070299.1.p1 GENE.GHVO01070299.1~~GHVO01070299.1.p1  ORF type:complete len:1600 (+),score=341.09 GHVO01070299.1:451-4800(+)